MHFHCEGKLIFELFKSKNIVLLQLKPRFDQHYRAPVGHCGTSWKYTAGFLHRSHFPKIDQQHDPAAGAFHIDTQDEVTLKKS